MKSKPKFELFWTRKNIFFFAKSVLLKEEIVEALFLGGGGRMLEVLLSVLPNI